MGSDDYHGARPCLTWVHVVRSPRSGSLGDSSSVDLVPHYRRLSPFHGLAWHAVCLQAVTGNFRRGRLSKDAKRNAGNWHAKRRSPCGREREERESKSVVDRARPSVSSGTSPRNGPGSSMWKPVRILRLRASSWRRCVRPPRRTLIKAYGTDTPVPANVRRQLVPSARRVE